MSDVFLLGKHQMGHILSEKKQFQPYHCRKNSEAPPIPIVYLFFCLSNFFRMMDPPWRKFLDPRLDIEWPVPTNSIFRYA